MATVTSNGKVASSGQGRTGLMASWRNYGQWLERDVPRLLGRIKAARTGK